MRRGKTKTQTHEGAAEEHDVAHFCDRFVTTTRKSSLTMVNSSIAFIAVSCLASGAVAFTNSGRVNNILSTHSSTTSIEAHSSSRRDFFATATTTTAALVATAANPAYAANAPPTPEELDRIKVGYENIKYLLANWEKETTVCRENGGECKRDADPVRRYMGLRSTTDPLFQIEKVFNKVKYMDDIDPDKLDSFFEATEDW